MAQKTLYMETTQISAEKTAAEIVSCLVTAGATQIATDYKEGRIVGLRWIMTIPGRGEMGFVMPARVEPIYTILKGRGRNTWLTDNQKREIREKAHRVAWRQLLRWVQAQVAMIDCGMTEAAEVFFPYIQAASGQTLFDAFKAGDLKALPPGDPQ